MTDNLLEIKNLIVEYTTEGDVVHAVNGVDLCIRHGESLGLVGETGAGKTTTALSVLNLISTPPGTIKSGEIIFEGQNLLKLPKRKMRAIRGNKISMIFQDPMTSLNPVYTVGEQIAEVIRLHEKCSKEEAAKKAGEMLEMVGIPAERYNEYPHQFSGGMKQRVVIAMSIACSPQLILADEPTTALDVTIQAQVLELMNELKAKMNTSMLLITHDLGVVRQYADRINVMYAGRIVESAPAKELLEHPRHAYTRALMKSIPGLHAKGTPLYTIPGLPPNMTQEPCGCSFRPRNTLGNPALCLTGREPELVEISPGHSVQNCPGCLA